MKAILTKYIPATNTRGERIKAYDMSGNSITIPYPYDIDAPSDAYLLAAKALCDKMKWEGELACGQIKDGYAFVFV